MVVRLHWHDLHVNMELSDGFVSWAEAPALLAMDEAVEQVMHAAESRMAEVQANIEAMLHEADQKVHALNERAQRDARSAKRLGYAQGKEQALANWLAEAFERQKQIKLSYQNQREYLAEWVVEAVRMMVQSAATSDFLTAALSTLDSVAEQNNSVVLHVHPNDELAAQEAIGRARTLWPDGFTIRIEVDSVLAPRSSRIETATEFMDASLDVQLRALRRRLRTKAFDPGLLPAVTEAQS